MNRISRMSMPGIAYVGPFANTNLHELRAWFGRGVIHLVCDPRGNTHLHRAVMEGAKPFVIQFLLKRGVDINARNETGETALMLAAWYGNEGLVELLLNRGADPDLKTRKGFSALGAASENGHTGIVTKLLAHGAKPFQRICRG